MVNFVYLKEEDDDIPKTGLPVKAGSNNTIFVSFDCIPISLKLFETLFPDILIDAKDYDCVIISIYDLYEKLMNTNIDSNIELAGSIRSYYDIEGWAWNIDMPNFEHFPEPFEQPHCWVRHIQSWKPMCKDCSKPDCPSVEILSHEISRLSLQEIYCDCQKCERCDFIYDNDECKCQLSRQKSSDDSSDSRFVCCENCCRTYDAFDETSIYMHNGRCC
jgi:hypothetical protein